MDQSTSSPLISPSKARRDAAQAKDWAYIASWLTRKYHPHSVPRFERNESTLKALLTLAAYNDAADEEAELVSKAREEDLERLRRQEAVVWDVNKDLLTEMESYLTPEGETALQDLAESTVGLSMIVTNTEELGERVIQLGKDEYQAKEQLRQVGYLQAYLEKELADLKRQIEDLKTNEVYNTPEGLQQQTTEWQQGTKMLSVKTGEYRDRIGVLEGYKVECPRIEDIKDEEREMIRLREKVKTLERRVQSFHGLPPDIAAAKEEFQAADEELRRLTRQRDAIFEGLVEGQSPAQKRR